jgi:hypothetical protein
MGTNLLKLRQILALVTSIVSVFGTNAYAECHQRILFIPQIHTNQLSGSDNPEVFQRVAEAQFEVARELISRKNIAVFAEGTYEPMTLDWYRSRASGGEEIIKNYRSSFPNSLSRTFGELNSDQRAKLVKAGGDLTLLLLGLIPKIYPIGSDQATENKFFSIAQQWLSSHPGQSLSEDSKMRYLTFERRDRLALQEINNFFKANPNRREATLLYGADHNFKLYPDLFNPECIFISESVKRVSDKLR